MTILVILCDAYCHVFSQTSRYTALPEFEQIAQTKRDWEDIYMPHYRALLNVTAVQIYINS